MKPWHINLKNIKKYKREEGEENNKRKEGSEETSKKNLCRKSYQP